MSQGYDRVAFTQHVRDAQARYGSRAALAKLERRGGSPPDEPRDALTNLERNFIVQRDGFYLAITSDTGWPYVQFRGGPPGFVRSPTEHSLAWADFHGNRQYISVGNNGVVFTGASSVAVTRYRYRGSTIPTPWTPAPAPG